MTRLDINSENYLDKNIHYLNLFKLYQYVFKVNTLIIKSRKNTLNEFKNLFQVIKDPSEIIKNESLLDTLLSTIHVVCLQLSSYPFTVDGQTLYFPYQELIQNVEFQNSIKAFVIQSTSSFNINPNLTVYQLIETTHKIGIQLLALNKQELVDSINSLVEQKISIPDTSPFKEAERLELIQLFMEYYYNKLKNILMIIIYKLIEKIFCLKNENVYIQNSEIYTQRKDILTAVESFVFNQLDIDSHFKFISYFRDSTTNFLKEKMNIDYNVEQDISDSQHDWAMKIMNSLSNLFFQSFSISFTERHLQTLMDESDNCIYHIFYSSTSLTLGEEVISGCLFVKEDITVTPSILTIQNVATLPQFRKHGIATNLIKTLLNINQLDFKLDLLLPTTEPNNWIKLIRFYSRFGFVPENISFDQNVNSYTLNLISINKPSRSLIMEQPVNQTQFQVYLNDLKIFLLHKCYKDPSASHLREEVCSLRFLNTLQSDYIFLLVENLYSNINKFSSNSQIPDMIQFLKKSSPNLGIMSLPNPLLDSIEIYNFNGNLYKFYANLTSNSPSFFIPYYDEMGTRHLFLLFDNFFNNPNVEQNIEDTLKMAIKGPTCHLYLSPFINDNKFESILKILNKICYMFDSIKVYEQHSLLKVQITIAAVDESTEQLTKCQLGLQDILNKRNEMVKTFLMSHICKFQVVISPNEFLSIRENGVVRIGHWDLVKDGPLNVLKNRTNDKEVNESLKKISYVHMRSQIDNYNLIKKTINDFLASTLKNGFDQKYCHTILPIMITREGVYIIYINPQFYIYARLLFEECRQTLLRLFSNTNTESNGIDKIEWLDISIKNKIKEIYDMYGVYQMEHNKKYVENVIFSNKNITNAILLNFKNYVDSLTIMSLTNSESTPTNEYLLLQKFCKLMEVETMPLFFTEVFSWDTILQHDMNEEYLEFELITISKDCPPFDVKEKKYKKKIAIEEPEIHKKAFLQDKLDVIMNTVKEIEQPVMSRPKRKMTSRDEDLEDLEESLTEMSVTRKSKRTMIVENALEQKEEEDIMKELEIVNELLNETMKQDQSAREIEEQSIILERRIYEELLQKEIEEFLEEEFKSQSDGSLEANSYQIELLRQIKIEEIIDNIQNINSELISLEQLHSFVDNVARLFIYRIEILSIMKSILRDLTYKGYSLNVSIKQVSELDDQFVLSKISDVDYNFITREELIELVRKAKFEYIEYLKTEIERLHIQLNKNIIFGIFDKVIGLLGLRSEDSIDYYLPYLDYNLDKITNHDKKILIEYLKEYFKKKEPQVIEKVEFNWEEEFRNEQEDLKSQIVDILQQYPREMFQDIKSPDGSSVDPDLINDIQSMIDPKYTTGMSQTEIADVIMNVIDLYESL